MSTPSESFLRAAARLDVPGGPRPETSAAPTIDAGEVWGALSTVIDPEIGLDIVTVGLVYGVEQIENAVRVTFTLTTPGCPMEEIITSGIVNAVSAVSGVEHVLPVLVWEPRWHPGMMAEDAW